MSVRHKHLLLLSVLASCVSYERDDTDAQSIAAEIGARTGGTYSIDEAVVLALHQNADLRAAVASVRAAGGERTVPLPARTNWRGRAEAVEILLDPIALLGLGPRGAAIDAGYARHAEAVAQLTVARWRVVAAVAEEFQIHAALNQLNVVDLKLDVVAFERAGLASTVAAQQLRAAQLRATSERAELRRAHSDNRARLRELLGLPDHAALTITTMPESWLQQPGGTAAELLSRPDLLLAAARFEVADRDFRKAVSDQYPSLQIGPNISLVGDPLRAMGMLKIPFAMDGLARAARERREAARANLEAAFLAATRDATTSEERFATAKAVADAAAMALQANAAALAASRIAIEVELHAFGSFSSAAGMVMRNTMEHRRAVIEMARATVQRARAFGWPRNQAIPGAVQ